MAGIQVAQSQAWCAVQPGQADLQHRAERHRDLAVRVGQEDRRHAGIVRRRDPGLHPGRGAGHIEQARQEARGEPAGCCRPRQDQGEQEGRQQHQAQPAGIVSEQAEARRSRPQALQARLRSVAMRLPDRLLERVRRRPGRTVEQGLQRPVTQAGASLDATVDYLARSRRGAAQRMPDTARDIARQQQHQGQVQPERQLLRQQQQGEDGETAQRRQRGQQDRPACLQAQDARRALPRTRQRLVRWGHVRVGLHGSHSGTISSRHRADIGWRGRMVVQRSPSTNACAASGRAL